MKWGWALIWRPWWRGITSVNLIMSPIETSSRRIHEDGHKCRESKWIEGLQRKYPKIRMVQIKCGYHWDLTRCGQLPFRCFIASHDRYGWIWGNLRGWILQEDTRSRRWGSEQLLWISVWQPAWSAVVRYRPVKGQGAGSRSVAVTGRND